MAASEAAVTAVQERMGCKPYDGVWNWANKPTCDRHGNDIWTDRGCPVAVAAADAAVDADRASIQAEALRALADWGDANRDYYYWGYDGISDAIRERADWIEGKS